MNRYNVYVYYVTREGRNRASFTNVEATDERHAQELAKRAMQKRPHIVSVTGVGKPSLVPEKKNV